jgi:probable F420-dependent oxidoreductase
MLIGFCLPQFGAMGLEAGAAARFAREAEGLGADSLWVGDRLLAPVRPVTGYAGSSTMPEEFRISLDPFAVLTTAAAVTTRALLGTSVLNAPFYSPALLARSLTTIDALSGGRLIPGLGVGWSPDEFLAVGVPMTERGERLDECLDVLDALWSRDPAAHKGKYFEVPEFHAGLKPVQQPAPPVYLAGHVPAALHRVATRAAGWLPVGMLPGGFDPVGIAGTLARLREQAASAGRREPEAILRLNLQPSATPADVAAAIARAEGETGIGHVMVDFMYVAHDVDHALDLAARVLAAAR